MCFALVVRVAFVDGVRRDGRVCKVLEPQVVVDHDRHAGEQKGFRGEPDEWKPFQALEVRRVGKDGKERDPQREPVKHKEQDVHSNDEQDGPDQNPFGNHCVFLHLFGQKVESGRNGHRHHDKG